MILERVRQKWQYLKNRRECRRFKKKNLSYLSLYDNSFFWWKNIIEACPAVKYPVTISGGDPITNNPPMGFVYIKLSCFEKKNIVGMVEEYLNDFKDYLPIVLEGFKVEI